jgi:hypothetical protein
MTALITEEHVDRIIQMLSHDIAVTIGGDYQEWIRSAAAAERELFDEWRASESDDEDEMGSSVEDFYLRVAERFQQELHDEFVDTSWPSCPDHRNHPLWLHGTAWICEAEFARIGYLGELPARAA